MLDGMVAVAAGKASARGEIVNDLPDRISDVIIFVGVAHSDLVNPLIGYWTAILSLFTAYVGLFGQAIGGRREFGGIMSKPWRMVALSLGAWAMFFIAHNHTILTILDWTCLVIIAGCLETIIIRLKRIVTALQNGSDDVSAERAARSGVSRYFLIVPVSLGIGGAILSFLHWWMKETARSGRPIVRGW